MSTITDLIYNADYNTMFCNVMAFIICIETVSGFCVIIKNMLSR